MISRSGDSGIIDRVTNKISKARQCCRTEKLLSVLMATWTWYRVYEEFCPIRHVAIPLRINQWFFITSMESFSDFGKLKQNC